MKPSSSILKFLKPSALALVVGLAIFTTQVVYANTISGAGATLTTSQATELDNYLGANNDYNLIYTGSTGASSTLYNSTVQGIVDTVSIYSIQVGTQQIQIGGYSAQAFGIASGYSNDVSLKDFIFNLNTNVKLSDANDVFGSGNNAIFSSAYTFANFGGGLDINGGTGTLGNGAYVNSNYSYGSGAGPLLAGGSSQKPQGINVLGLQVYQVSAVPEPKTYAMLLAGLVLLGLFAYRRKNDSSDMQLAA